MLTLKDLNSCAQASTHSHVELQTSSGQLAPSLIESALDQQIEPPSPVVCQIDMESQIGPGKHYSPLNRDFMGFHVGLGKGSCLASALRLELGLDERLFNMHRPPSI